MNPGHLSLFIPVTERLPEERLKTNIIVNGHNEHMGIYDPDKGWSIMYVDGWSTEEAFVEEHSYIVTEVTHWQDKNSLTTKQRSIKLIKDAYVEGMEAEASLNLMGQRKRDMEAFINEKQKEL